MASRGAVVGSAILLVLASALVGPGCSHNPRRPAAGWTAHDSRNVRVYSSTFIEHRFAQEWMETAFHAYKHSFFKDLTLRPLEAMFLQVEPGGLTRIYLPNDDPPNAWSLEGMPGGGRIGKDGLIVLTERRDFRGASKQVAYQLIGQAIPNAPLWLRVGFGQYLSEYRVHYRGSRWRDSSWRDSSWIVCYGSDRGFLSPSHFAGELGARAQTVRAVPGRDVLIPIDEVLTSDWYEYAKNGRYWFNFTAYAFVSYLIHGRDTFHASRFPVLLRALAEGKSSADALALAYPHILPDELDEELANFVRAPRRGVFWEERPDGLCFPIPPGHHAEKKTADSPVAESDVQAALDDLKRLPLWRRYGSWYPSDVLLSEAGVLVKTPVRGGAEKPGRPEIAPPPPQPPVRPDTPAPPR